MKKLISLLSAASVISVAPLSVACATSQNNTGLINSSAAIAKALVEKQTNDLNSSDVLIDEEKSNANLANDLKQYFGTSDPTKLSSLIDQNSAIKDTDSSNAGKPFGMPDSMNVLVTMAQEIINSKDPSQLFQVLFTMNLTKILGSILAKSNPIFKVLTQIPLGAIIGAIKNYNQDYSGLDSYGTFDPSTLGKGITPHLKDNTLVETAIGNLSFGLVPLAQGKKIDWGLIASFALGLINYLSQFNFKTSGAVGDDMYSNGATNQDSHKTVDNSKPAAFNFTNLSNLLSNILHYDTNNGLGLAQLIDVLFGSEKPTIGISNNYNDLKVSGLDQSDISKWTMDLVPDLDYENPWMAGFSRLLGKGGIAPIILPKLGISQDLINLISTNNLIPQIIAMLGGLIDNIATNRSIDNQANMLFYLASIVQSTIVKNAKAMGISADDANTIAKSMTNLMTMYLSQARKDPNFFNVKDNFDLKYNPKNPNVDLHYGTLYSAPAHSWDELFNGNIGWYSEFAKPINSIFTNFKIGFQLPSEFTNIKTLINNLLDSKVGPNLTVKEMLQILDDKNGLIQTLLKNMSKIVTMFENIWSALTDKTSLAAGAKWINNYIDLSKDKSGQMQKYMDIINGKTQTQNNLAIEIATISIAQSENAFKNNGSDALAKQEAFSLLGYCDPTTGQPLANPTGVYKVLSDNWTLIQTILKGMMVSVKDLNSLVDAYQSVNTDFAKDSSIKLTKKGNNYSYQLTDKATGKVYDIDLIYSSATKLYKVDVKLG